MRKICLVAVDIRSTHNIGSIFRSADGFGAEIVLVGICPRPKGDPNEDRLPHVTAKAHDAIAKTALGAESTVVWRYFANIDEAVQNLRAEGFRILAIEQGPNAKDMRKLKLEGPSALLLGPEVEGLPERITSICDDMYEIAMVGQKESFNVSVSAGIALYQTSLY